MASKGYVSGRPLTRQAKKKSYASQLKTFGRSAGKILFKLAERSLASPGILNRSLRFPFPDKKV